MRVKVQESQYFPKLSIFYFIFIHSFILNFDGKKLLFKGAY